MMDFPEELSILETVPWAAI